MPHLLVIDEIDQRLLGGSLRDDPVGDTLGIVIEHEHQAELGGRRSFEIQPVEHGFLEHLLMRPDDLAEVLQLAQRDEAQTLERSAAELEVLDIAVDGLLPVLLEDSFGDPVPEVLGRTGVLVVLLAVAGLGLALCDVHDIVLAATPEFVPLRVSDHIIGRRDALTHVANDAGIESKRSERLHFHCCGPIVLSESIWSMSWRGAERRRIPKRDSWRLGSQPTSSRTVAGAARCATGLKALQTHENQNDTRGGEYCQQPTCARAGLTHLNWPSVSPRSETWLLHSADRDDILTNSINFW